MGPRDGDRVGSIAPWGPRGTRAVLSAAGAWLGAAWLIGASGRLTTLRPPAPQLVLVGVTLALLVAPLAWPTLRRFVWTVDLRALVLFHLTRFVGFYFLVLHARGELPWAFAVPGGWGDNVVAATGLLLVMLVRPDRPGGRRAYLVWNVVGLLDILAVVLTAARLAFGDPESMRALLQLPLSLLLTFVVPIIIVTHVWMLGRLARARAAR
ncbi:MAG TPA: hypothetical protein VHO73_06815 [Methylomirabilota bacterium]|nr:hypothetical protein [Methylomirabilota bacterium]